mgnify:FL=1
MRCRTSGVRHRREFFDLQLDFARRVAPIAGISLADAVLGYTNVYVRLAIGRAFDPEHPVWRDYAAGLERADDPGAWTYQFHLTRPLEGPPGVEAVFGCFAYTLESPQRLRLHFENREERGVAPLSLERAEARREELRRLLAHARQAHPSLREVAGVSWLYNLPAYRRLFPALARKWQRNLLCQRQRTVDER